MLEIDVFAARSQLYLQVILGTNKIVKSSHLSQVNTWPTPTSGHLEVVKLLLEKGARVNQRTHFYRRTALMYAARKGHLQIVQKLVENGANVYLKNLGR